MNRHHFETTRMERRIVRSDRGFTLVELMVSVGIFAVVTLAAFAVLTSSQKTSVTMDQTVQIQQNVRMALDLMARDIRMTGYGYPAAGALGGCAQHMNAVDSTVVSDSISVMTMDQQIGTLGAAFTANNTITLAGALPSDMAVGQVISVDGIFTGTVANFSTGAKTITLFQTGTVIPLNVIAPANFQTTAPVVRLACVTYTVTDGTVTPPYQLMRNGVALVDGIESIQLAYGIDADGDGRIDDQLGGQANVMDCLDFIPNNTPCMQGGTALAAGLVPVLPPTVNATPTTVRLARITVVGRAVPPANVNVANSTWYDENYQGNSAVQAENQAIAGTPGIRRRALTRVIGLRDAAIL